MFTMINNERSNNKNQEEKIIPEKKKVTAVSLPPKIKPSTIKGSKIEKAFYVLANSK
jgi:hypothetical protein